MDHWVVVAGVLAVSSVAVSLFEIVRHLSNFTKPYLQRYIVRILLMVPIYSLNAWIAMLVPASGLYLDSMREVYESYVIYSFMKYLLNFLKYDTNLQQYIHHKPGPSHIFPLCCLPRCIGGRLFLTRCKHGILQYVVVRPITTLIAFSSQLLGFYGEGNYNPLSGNVYPVLLLVNNASQITAMYSLVIFYTGYQHELRPMKPLAKFFSIKLVVFFSFFQSVVISGLLEVDAIESIMSQLFPGPPDKVSLSRKVQELLICFDMLLASVGHLFAFPHKPFTEPDDRPSARLDGLSASPRWRRLNRRAPVSPLASQTLADDQELYGDYHEERSCCGAFFSLFDFTEDKSDITEHFSTLFQKLRQLFTLGPALPRVESQHPLDDDQDEDDQDENHNGHIDTQNRRPNAPSTGLLRPISPSEPTSAGPTLEDTTDNQQPINETQKRSYQSI